MAHGPSWTDEGGNLPPEFVYLTCHGCDKLRVNDFHYYYCAALTAPVKTYYMDDMRYLRTYHPAPDCPYPVRNPEQQPMDTVTPSKCGHPVRIDQSWLRWLGEI